ncbi:MAG: hypothetical protein ACKPKO_52705, partial [Candidatus Fonsibacter sp.]
AGGGGGQVPATRRPSGSSAASLSIDRGDIVYEERRTVLTEQFVKSMHDASGTACLTPPRSRLPMSPPMAPPEQPPIVDPSIESHVDSIMQELMEKNDQMKFMETRTKDTEEFAFLAEARLRSAEQAFRMEAEQNEILADMAKEVSRDQSPE